MKCWLLFNNLFVILVPLYHFHLQQRGFRNVWLNTIHFSLSQSLFLSILRIFFSSHHFTFFLLSLMCCLFLFRLFSSQYGFSIPRKKSIIIMQTSNSFMFYYSYYFVVSLFLELKFIFFLFLLLMLSLHLLLSVRWFRCLIQFGFCSFSFCSGFNVFILPWATFACIGMAHPLHGFHLACA